MRNSRHRFFPLSTFLLLGSLVACAPTETRQPMFRSGVEQGPVPWTREPGANDGPLRFAIVGDRTGGMYPGVFEASLPRVNLLQPDLVMSVGDITETWLAEDREGVVAVWEELDRIADGLDAPMFYTVGNHDIGDELTASVWQERYGPSYYHFVYKDVLFISLNTEDPPFGIPETYGEAMAALELRRREPDAIDSAAFAERRAAGLARRRTRPIGAISDAQVSYVRRALEENPGVQWTFLFAHRPSWETEDIDPNFVAIEEALADRDYTYFAGHFHSYSHVKRQGMDYVRLATTGGAWLASDGKPDEVDHVTWVTMTDDGPVIANIGLDGIFDKTGERTPLRPPLSKQD